MADEAHLALLKQGVSVWNHWQQQTQVSPNLVGVDLSQINLAILIGAQLTGAETTHTKSEPINSDS